MEPFATVRERCTFHVEVRQARRTSAANCTGSGYVRGMYATSTAVPVSTTAQTYSLAAGVSPRQADPDRGTLTASRNAPSPWGTPASTPLDRFGVSVMGAPA